MLKRQGGDKSVQARKKTGKSSGQVLDVEKRKLKRKMASLPSAKLKRMYEETLEESGKFAERAEREIDALREKLAAERATIETRLRAKEAERDVLKERLAQRGGEQAALVERLAALASSVSEVGATRQERRDAVFALQLENSRLRERAAAISKDNDADSNVVSMFKDFILSDEMKQLMSQKRGKRAKNGSMRRYGRAERARERRLDDGEPMSAKIRAAEALDEESEAERLRIIEQESAAYDAANLHQKGITVHERRALGAALGASLETDKTYMECRAFLLREWYLRPKKQLVLEKISKKVDSRVLPIMRVAFEYLERFGYINVGVYEELAPPAPNGESVVVIGAGFAGLSAARQLRSFGYKVVVLEARNRIGGRCSSDTSFATPGEQPAGAVDMGASIITGTTGNPIMWVVRQTNVATHKLHSECPLYDADGAQVDETAVNAAGDRFDNILEVCGKLRGPHKTSVSLGASMRRVVAGSGAQNAVHARAFWWFWSNLEYACATNLDNISLNEWDQDDEFMLRGDHLLVRNGFQEILTHLAGGTDVRLNQHVERVTLPSAGGVRVTLRGGETIDATRCVCTVPLGVLQANAIEFEPPLPKLTRDSIGRLGFGLINKVVMLFETSFWQPHLDYFGYAGLDEQTRGNPYIFWNLQRSMHSPVLVALITGEAAERVEHEDSQAVVERVLRVLRSVFGADKVGKVIKHSVTAWRSDPYSRGTYSFIPPNATGQDYEQLAQPINDGRLFFAGEATSRQYPATTTGAMFSGLHQAGELDLIAVKQRAAEKKTPPPQTQKSEQK